MRCTFMTPTSLKGTIYFFPLSRSLSHSLCFKRPCGHQTVSSCAYEGLLSSGWTVAAAATPVVLGWCFCPHILQPLFIASITGFIKRIMLTVSCALMASRCGVMRERTPGHSCPNSRLKGPRHWYWVSDEEWNRRSEHNKASLLAGQLTISPLLALLAVMS